MSLSENDNLQLTPRSLPKNCRLQIVHCWKLQLTPRSLLGIAIDTSFGLFTDTSPDVSNASPGVSGTRNASSWKISTRETGPPRSSIAN